MVRRSALLLILAGIASQISSGCCWCYRPIFNRLSHGGAILGSPLLPHGAPITAPAPLISDVGHAPIISGPAPIMSGAVPGCAGCGASNFPISSPITGPISGPISGGMIAKGPVMTGPMPNGVGGYPVATGPMPNMAMPSAPIAGGTYAPNTTTNPVLIGSSTVGPTGYAGYTSSPASLGAPLVTRESSTQLPPPSVMPMNK
jgi:hypothetical protein